jgi:thiamine-phosphate pyrophosphorylase
VRAAVAAGVDWVQLRDRALEGGACLAAARAFARAVLEGAGERAPRCALLVNRRLDVAIALAAELGGALPVGVHLGFDAPPLAAAREALTALAGAAGPVGVAAHAAPEVAQAAAAGADYAHLAPVFDPLSKPRERPALGTRALAEASQGLGACRLLAQGGIEGARAGEAVRAGAHGVAVTGAILAAPDPAAAAAALRATLDAAARARGATPLSPGTPAAEDGR